MTNIRRALQATAGGGVSPPAIIISTKDSPYLDAWEWDASGFGTKYSDPSTLMTAMAYDLAVSPTEDALLVPYDVANGMAAYAWDGGFGTKYTNAAISDVGYAAAFNSDGTVALLGTNKDAMEGINAFNFNSASGFGSEFAAPTTSGSWHGYGVAFHPSDTAVAAAHSTSPYIDAFPWSGSGFGTRYSNPSTLPPANAVCCNFSNDGSALGVGHGSSPYVSVYAWSSGFGSKYSDPSTTPAELVRRLSWSADSATLACICNSGDKLDVYPWSSGFGTRYSAAGTLPAGNGQAVAWSADGDYIGVASSSSPYIQVYPFDTSSGIGTKWSNPGSGASGNAVGIAFLGGPP